MDELNAHAWNLRQYHEMDSLLGIYARGRLSLNRLISYLERVLDSLYVEEGTWQYDFKQELGRLEIVYATALACEEDAALPDPTTQTRISELLETLKQLLAPKLLEVENTD